MVDTPNPSDPPPKTKARERHSVRRLEDQNVPILIKELAQSHASD